MLALLGAHHILHVSRVRVNNHRLYVLVRVKGASISGYHDFRLCFNFPLTDFMHLFFMTPTTKRPGPNFHIVNSNGSDSIRLALLFSYKVVNSCKCALPYKLLLYHQPLTKIGQGYKSLRSYISVMMVGNNLLLLFRKIRFLAIMVKPLISIIISSLNPFLHTVYAPGIRPSS